MRQFSLVMVLFCLFFLTLPAFAQDSDEDLDLDLDLSAEADGDLSAGDSEPAAPEGRPDSDDGPVFIAEFSPMNLGGGDKMSIFRMAPGYTFKSGFQLGANLARFSLDRPSVNGKIYLDGCEVPPGASIPDDAEPYTLSPEFAYWGFGPTLGYDAELINGWFGVEFMANLSFPITNNSSGWSLEISSYAYLSLEALTGNKVDLALMGGLKYGYFEVEADRYQIEERRMMPGFGVMLQF